MFKKQSSPKHIHTTAPRGQAPAEMTAGRRFAGNSRVKRSYAILWRQTLWGIAAAIGAFLLGRCPLLFETRPLGIALLCAATHQIPYLYGGLLLSALTAEEGRVILCCTYTAVLVIRVLSRSTIELPGAGRPPSPTQLRRTSLTAIPNPQKRPPHERTRRPPIYAPPAAAWEPCFPIGFPKASICA